MPTSFALDLTGGVLMGLVYPFNLREIGNAVSLWLGIEPYELFFYVFLPPLLLDAALKIDWYIFKKVNARKSRQLLNVGLHAAAAAGCGAQNRPVHLKNGGHSAAQGSSSAWHP